MKKVFFIIVLFSLSLNVMAQDRSMDIIIIYGNDISRLDNVIGIGELLGLNKQKLRILRNTIFARYGYIFASNDMEEHFSKMPWYNGVSRNVQNRLTRTDWINIALIQSLENSAFPGFVRIEGGTFQMGSNNGRPDESPAHTVTVSSFYMGMTEVTQREFMELTMSVRFAARNSAGDWPASVNWYEAVEYCNRRSLREGLTPAYTIIKDEGRIFNPWTITWNRSANGYRLPTEAEWEYAAKGGNGSPDSNYFDEAVRRTRQPVGTTKPNGLGLYDMSGNVAEWCWDWYDENYYSNSPQNDPAGPDSGAQHVVRGGYTSEERVELRYTRRGSERLGAEINFRLVRNAD